MPQFLLFAFIYGVLVFIWSFVFINRSHDRVNRSFLCFLSVVLLWMVLSMGNDLNDTSFIGLLLKTIYWYCMLNMAPFFLLFVYRLVRRKPDAWFYAVVLLNTLTLFSRYLFPIDYQDPTFWRLETPIVAPLMSAIFSVPAVYALMLIVRQLRITREKRQKNQLRWVLWGAGLACVISVMSEYLLPTAFHFDAKLHLMFCAILIYVIAIFISIMKYRFLNIRSDYIFRKLFFNASDGIIIINRSQRIVSINHMAQEILGDKHLDSGDWIPDYIPNYEFDIDYDKREIKTIADGRERYLSVTQYPIDTDDKKFAKLLTVTDITSAKLDQKREKDLLLEKTIIDQTTWLYNKQYLFDKYYLGEGQAPNERLTIIFIDVDDFKTINDTYGHIVGDLVIMRIASCIKSVLHFGNEAIRFGGDEFVVVLKDVSLEDASSMTKQIHDCVNELDFSDCAQDLRVTLSIGLIDGTEPIKDLLFKADMAMYRSKGKGKNTTTVYSPGGKDADFHMKI